MQRPDSRGILRFGDFELDIGAYQLRRLGRPVKLGRQPMDLLILLVEGRRQLVTRSDIVDRLWGKDVFVDVDTGVNTAISKIRQVLRDSSEAPAFVETVPGKGYRFIADVEPVAATAASAAGVLQPELAITPAHSVSAIQTGSVRSDAQPFTPLAGSPATVVIQPEEIPSSRSKSGTRSRLGMGLLILAAVLGIVQFTRLKGGDRPSSVTLAVLPLRTSGAIPSASTSPLGSPTKPARRSRRSIRRT